MDTSNTVEKDLLTDGNPVTLVGLSSKNSDAHYLKLCTQPLTLENGEVRLAGYSSENCDDVGSGACLLYTSDAADD